MNSQKSQLIAIMAFLFLPTLLFSQFTYIDVSVGNRFMKMSQSQVRKITSTYNQTNIHVNGLWRIRRHFGVGVTASVPLRQGGKYRLTSFNGSAVTKYTIPSDIDFDYHFNESAKVAFNGRLYGGIKGNFYLDGRISIFSMTEHLNVKYYGYSLLENNVFKQIAPGFSVGMQPHFGKKVFMNVNMSWDFYTFKGTGFKNGNYNTNESYYVDIPDGDSFSFYSAVPDKKSVFSINLGLGYFF